MPVYCGMSLFSFSILLMFLYRSLMVWDTSREEPGGTFDKGTAKEAKVDKPDVDTEQQNLRTDAKSSHPLVNRNANVSDYVKNNGHVAQDLKPSKNGDSVKHTPRENGNGKEKAKERKHHKEKKHKKHSDERKHKSHKDHKHHKHHKKSEQILDKKVVSPQISKSQVGLGDTDSSKSTVTLPAVEKRISELEHPFVNGDIPVHPSTTQSESATVSDTATNNNVASLRRVLTAPAEILNNKKVTNESSDEACTSSLPCLQSNNQSTVDGLSGAKDSAKCVTAKSVPLLNPPLHIGTNNVELVNTSGEAQSAQQLVAEVSSGELVEQAQTQGRLDEKDKCKKVQPITIKLNSDSASSCVVSKDGKHEKG